MFFKRKSSYRVATLIAVAFCQQKEEGKVQGQLNHTDSTQYIRDLKSQIDELKHEVRRPSLILHCVEDYVLQNVFVLLAGNADVFHNTI